MTKKWLGKPPAVCDACEAPIVKEFYDARTRSGRWGNFCSTCFLLHTSGKLGTGYGQHYAYSNGAWEKQA